MARATEPEPTWGSAEPAVRPPGPERGAAGTWDVGHESADVRALAVKRLNKKRDFRTHLFSWLVVNGMLNGSWLVIGISSGAWFYWPVFPALGWGIGLAFHAWDVYGPPSRPIDQAAIDREIERMRRR